jgi:hypothetical protein
VLIPILKISACADVSRRIRMKKKFIGDGGITLLRSLFGVIFGRG